MITPFQKGEPVSGVLSAARLNEIVSELNDLREQVASQLAELQGRTLSVQFKVTAPVEGQAGRYTGQLYVTQPAAEDTEDLSEDDLGDPVEGEAIGWDWTAITGTSNLVADTTIPGRVVGHDEQNRPVVELLTGRESGFWAKITSNTQDGSNKRWKYAWSEATKATAGYGGWTVPSEGRSGTTTIRPIYNSIEEGNGASGTYHNGVDSTNLSGTFDILPIPNNTYVWVRTLSVADGTTEYWTSYENGVDGECE